MRGKFIGETYGDYVNDRNYFTWETGKGYNIHTEIRTLDKHGTGKLRPYLCVLDNDTALMSPYDNLEEMLENWELEG